MKRRPCVLLVDELDKVDHNIDAQAFKRACSCFGLGRYFYDIQAVWVDLDQNRQPVRTPALFPPRALPENWRKGMRPGRNGNGERSFLPFFPTVQQWGRSHPANRSSTPQGFPATAITLPETPSTPARVGAPTATTSMPVSCRLEKTVGTPFCIGTSSASTAALAAQPKLIRDPAVKRTVLQMLESAIRGIERLEAVTRRLDAKTVRGSTSSKPRH